MSIADPPRKTMTAEELMAMPDDGIDRWIIRGELIERPSESMGWGQGGRPMTMRNDVHSEVEALTTTSLGNWLRTQPPPRGKVLCGEAGFLNISLITWNEKVTIGPALAPPEDDPTTIDEPVTEENA